MSDKKDELFKQAREESIKAAIIIHDAETPSRIAEMKEQTIATIKERLAEGETQWDLLKRMVDGSLTERFIEVIGEMPDRDFVRNYLKLLEHFKPKLVRGEDTSGEKQDTTINIVAVMLDKEGEQKTIELNEYEKARNEGKII